MKCGFEGSASGLFINGVVFFFESGEIDIARQTLKLIEKSHQQPTTIMWNSYDLNVSETLMMLNEPDILDDGELGVRFTLYDSVLLRKYLDFLKEKYPAVLPVIDDIDRKMFGTFH